MHSSLLKQHGLNNYIAGSDFNFRYQKVGKAIEKDISKIIEEMKIGLVGLYSGQQTHSANIAYADGQNGETFIYGRTFKETDGLITDQPGIGLFVKFADCTPVVLFDPVKKVQAIVHSGWRGTTKRISEKAIEKMTLEFGCNLDNLIAYLGPSIDIDHYEVGPEVYEAFQAFSNRDQFFRPSGDKYHLSMLDANLDILTAAGIKPEQIQVERASTFTESTLHSARREGADYGLNGMLTIMGGQTKE